MDRRWLLLGAVLLSTALAFAPALANPFWSDDITWLTRAVAAQRDWRLPFTMTFLRDYNPLAYLSFALNLTWGGTRPWAWHATDLAIHLGCVSLVYALGLRLLASAPAAAVGALLFGCHVAIVEPVVWSAARVHSEALLSVLAAANAVLLPWPWARLGLAPLLLAVALGFKETALGFVAFLPTYGLWCRLRGCPLPASLWAAASAHAGVAVAMAALRVLLLPSEHVARTLGSFDPGVALGKVALTIASFLGLDGWITGSLPGLLVPLGVLCVAGLAGRDRARAFAAIFALAMMAPYLPAPKHSSRYCYMAWPGLALLAARLGQLAWARCRHRASRLALVGLLGCLLAWSLHGIRVEIRDYGRLGSLGAAQLQAFQPMARAFEGRLRRQGSFVAILVDDSTRLPVRELLPRLEGKPKLVNPRRRGAVEGMSTFAEIANVILHEGRTAYLEPLTLGEASSALDDAAGAPVLVVYRGGGAAGVELRDVPAPELRSWLGKAPSRAAAGRVVPY